jgi:hypothetical protein
VTDPPQPTLFIILAATVILPTESPEALTPWFYSYQVEFLRLMKFTEHERLDHPMAGER